MLRRFRVIFNAVRTHFQQVERQVGLGGALVWALHEIERQDGLGVSALAERMDIHQSTASNLVRTLVQRGLVQTEKSAQDRRSTQLRLTPAGQALLAQVPGPFEGVLPVALAQLPPEKLAQLDAHLAELIGLLGADEAAAGIPLANL
ncbi:MAG: MarR family winged helix-turn-helix transcriptional regulator [Rhodoferax sp.]